MSDKNGNSHMVVTEGGTDQQPPAPALYSSYTLYFPLALILYCRTGKFFQQIRDINLEPFTVEFPIFRMR